MIDWLAHTWWSYDPHAAGHSLYRGFNLLEGCFWLLFAAIVLARYIKHKRSTLEIWYALSFVAFAASDFREAYRLQTWLIVAKGLNLAAILLLRRAVLSRFYPDLRSF